ARWQGVLLDQWRPATARSRCGRYAHGFRPWHDVRDDDFARRSLLDLEHPRIVDVPAFVQSLAGCDVLHPASNSARIPARNEHSDIHDGAHVLMQRARLDDESTIDRALR